MYEMLNLTKKCQKIIEILCNIMDDDIKCQIYQCKWNSKDPVGVSHIRQTNTMAPGKVQQLKQLGKLHDKKNRKSSDNVTRGAPPAWASDSLLRVRSWPPIVRVIHSCFNSEGQQIRAVRSKAELDLNKQCRLC